MKSFKQYTKKPMVNNPFLDWKSSFGEIRKNKKLPENPFLDWKSSFGEIRQLPSIKEELQQALKHHDKVSLYGVHDKIHDHEDVKSSTPLSEDHINSIKHYTSSSGSYDINGYLRNRMGHIDSSMSIGRQYYQNEVLRHINNLSSAFNSEHTNKQPIETYSGIPPHIGERLRQLGKGQTTHLPGFTSTSTSQHTARNYALKAGGHHPTKPKHIIKFHVHPGAGLSITPHSTYPDENEILLNHGTKVTYLKSVTRTDPNTGFKFTVHHMEAHPEDRMTLDQYPHEYEHNR